jgi:hypothetical protein
MHLEKNMNVSQHWLRVTLGLIVMLLALLAANALSLRLQSNYHQVDIGVRADRHFLAGVFSQEENESGVRYRWTRAESILIFDNFVVAPWPFLVLNIGGIPGTAPAPRPVQMYVDGKAWLTLPVSAASRRYTLMLPPTALSDGNVRIAMTSDTSRVPPDRRDVGIRLDQVGIGWRAGTWALPAWQTLLAQWALVATVLAGAWRLALPRRWMIGSAGALVLLLAWMTGHEPLIAATWQYRLLVAGLAALVLLWAVFPRLTALLPGHEHDPAAARAELRWLLLLTFGTLAVRLFAVLYPVFDSHDWYIHEERLWDFQFGSVLLFDKPAEFSNRIAIVPPAFYVLVAPWTLLTTNTVPTTQGLYAFLDGCAVLLLALFVRQIGGSARAAWLALLALALLPIQFTALWWGFGPQVIGQALLLALAVAVAYPHIEARWMWLAAGVLFVVIILVHNGVALLAGFWLAGYAALVWLFQRHERQHWMGWGAVAVASALVALLMLYSDVVALQLRGVSSNERLSFTEQDIFRVKYTLGSLCASFQPLSVACDQYLGGTATSSLLPAISVTLVGLLLPLACLLVLLQRVRGLHRWLVVAWLGSALLFFAVDLAFGLQVRYAYFSVPLVCAGLGMLLDRLTLRHWLGWLLAACIIGLIAVAGLALWYEGVWPALKPSLRLLTH